MASTTDLHARLDLIKANSLSSEQFKNIIRANSPILSIKKSYPIIQETICLFEEWAGFDGEEAIKVSSDLYNYYAGESFLYYIARNSIIAGWPQDKASSLYDKMSFRDTEAQSILGKQHPEFFAECYKEDEDLKEIEGLLFALALENPQKALDFYSQNKSLGTYENWVHPMILAGWSQYNFNEAVAWLTEESNPISSDCIVECLYTIFNMLAEVNIGDAISKITELSSDYRDYAIIGVARYKFRSDPVGAFQWIEQNYSELFIADAKNPSLTNSIIGKVSYQQHCLYPPNTTDLIKEYDRLCNLYAIYTFHYDRDTVDIIADYGNAKIGDIDAVFLAYTTCEQSQKRDETLEYIATYRNYRNEPSEDIINTLPEAIRSRCIEGKGNL